MPFHFNNKKVFLTYSKCFLDPEEILRRVRTIVTPTDIKWYIVAREEHEDGTYHIHALFEFAQAVQTRNERFFDIKWECAAVSGYNYNKRFAETDLVSYVFHPNIRSVLNLRKQVDYVCKKGNFIHEGIDLDALIQKKASRLLTVANAIKSGTTLRDINNDHPDLLMMHFQKLEAYSNYCQVARVEDARRPWRPISLTNQDMDHGVQALTNWLNSAIQQSRPPRSPMLYLHGPPGIGKTRLVSQLSQFLRVYHIPTDEPYYDLYEDGQYDVAVLDEFRGHVTIQWLNKWLEGSIMPLRKRMRSYLKKDNLPTIILSNYSPQQAYRKKSAALDAGFAALLSRLTVIELTSEFLLNFDDPVTLEYEEIFDTPPVSPTQPPTPDAPPRPVLPTLYADDEVVEDSDVDSDDEYVNRGWKDLSGRRFFMFIGSPKASTLVDTRALIDLTQDELEIDDDPQCDI